MVTNFFANNVTEESDALLDRLRAATIGLYDVAGEIGRGGMAVVYIATDMRLGRKVAIKVMEPRLSFTPGMAERFLQEARIAAQLQHHNIIVVHEVQQNAELIFFVMRLVEGGSLDEICRRLAKKERKLPLDQAQWILWQSARALAYAHSEGIVHRDVKPANIMVTTKGEVVVTDFGIAKAADGEGLTKSGMAIGTPVYMSPEQFSGAEPVSGAADQYALGVAAYELLAGAPPFSGDLYRLIAAHGSTPPVDVRELRPDCPAPLAEAVMRMLAKKSSDRWPTLEAVLPVLGEGLSIDGSSTRGDLAAIASDLQAVRAESVAAWAAMAPNTPAWTSGSRKRQLAAAAAVSVSPPHAEVGVGAELSLRAVVTADTGATLADARVSWRSRNPEIATVSADGVVRAVAAGAASILATVDAVAGSSGAGTTGTVQSVVEITVTARVAARVRIVQGEQALECGEAMLLTADVTDAAGTRVTDADVVWSSSHPEVLHVDTRGTLMALGGGVATVTARVGAVMGTTRVSVREAPVGAVTLTLESPSVSVGETVALTLAVTDVSGLTRSADGLIVISEAPHVAEVRRDPLVVVGKSGGKVTLRVLTDESTGASLSSVRAPWASAELVVRPVAQVAVPVAPAVPPARVEPVRATPVSAPAIPAAVPAAVPAAAPSTAPAPIHAAAAAANVPSPLSVAPSASSGSVTPEVDVPASARRSPTLLLGGAGLVAAALVVFALTRGGGATGDATVPQSDSVTVATQTDSAAILAAARQADDVLPVVEPPVQTVADAGGGSAAASVERAGATGAASAAVKPEPARREPAPAPVRTERSAAATPPASATGGSANRGASPTTTTRPPSSGSAPTGAAAGAGVVATPPVAPPQEETPPPPARVEAIGPSDADVKSLGRAFVTRLSAGEFRTGELASFFSRTTSSHKVQIVGEPRLAGRQGESAQVDVTVRLERTMGSGAIQEKQSTVRLVMRGRPGEATIASATAGALSNPRE